MQENFPLLKSILEKLHKEKCLDQVVLIGSWASYFYHLHFDSPDYRPVIRTTDVDFLIPNPGKVNSKLNVNLGEVFEELHFVKHFHRSGMIKYESKDLTIEFLVPEMGRGNGAPIKIGGLNVTAQPLRFLNMLTEKLLVVEYGELRVKVPDPIAYGFHKLIISGRRLKKEKQSKDYFTATELLHFLKTKGMQGKIDSYFDSLPKTWQGKIRSILKSAGDLEILPEKD